MNKLKTIICAIVLLLGAAAVAADGAMLLGAERPTQYAVNAVFFLVVLPACISIGQFDKLFHPMTKRG